MRWWGNGRRSIYAAAGLPSVAWASRGMRWERGNAGETRGEKSPSTDLTYHMEAIITLPRYEALREGRLHPSSFFEFEKFAERFELPVTKIASIVKG